MKLSLLVFFVLQFAILNTLFSITNAQVYKPDSPLAHTYSIVAIDESTGDMGVAVQSHWFSVGTIVSWGEAGVGVVATQSFVNPAFGPDGLALLKEGKSPREALD
ncbi:MAG: Zn-dependent protease, partial [Ignavibacteriae bacterium HGW-Ignavibacteriae-3]